MEKNFKLQQPRMPNFIRIEMGGTSKKQEGFKELPSISVADLTQEEANEYAEEMKNEFLKHWNTRSE